MSIENDAPLLQVMSHFGVSADALLGIGGEACVFLLSARRVLRVHHPGTRRSTIEDRTELLAELQLSAREVPFSIPHVLDTAEVHGRWVTIEPHLPGRPLSLVLAEACGAPREELLAAYLHCSTQLRYLRVERPWYGDLCAAEPIRASTYASYLERRARTSLLVAGDAFASVSASALAAALPEPLEPSLVHLDLFPGNVLVEGNAVSAVVDFGGVPIVGDARLDRLAAASYLTPFITPHAIPADAELAAAWLQAQGLEAHFEPARRWLAARWSSARDDRQLHRWCQSVLLSAS